MKKRLFAGIAFVGVALLTSLGVWQVQRLGWKRDLIERVDARVNAPAVAAPDLERFDARNDEYRRISLRGHFLNDRETLVQAATRLGGGFWIMTPLRADDGFTVLVNRGFVTASQRQSRAWQRAEGEVTITGLLRLDEPGGGFLRENQPYADRWYSRDIQEIGAVRGVELAPYFIDEDAPKGAQVPAKGPVPGLTVVKFNDNHLQYALTWFTLALMLAWGGFRILRS